nr:anthranilate synthase component I family protein [Planctomonas sp. JC2975]
MVDAPRWRNSDDEYLRMIASCQESIHDGDAYQLCLTTQVSVTTDEDPFDVYLRVRCGSLAGHGGFIRVGDTALLSASPELYLTVGDGVAVSRPVKGTRRRGRTAAEDAELRTELAADDKERAENLMIVDLMRNDLGRIARLGGVSVTELLEVETHEHVHQLVSTVRAEMADGVDVFDVLEASFPAGSMTGAPKLSAMRILHGLEAGPRGIYSGCFGRIGCDGSAELAMVIRSIVMRDGQAAIGTGGGITALSVPRNELAEVKLKAAALLAALGG